MLRAKTMDILCFLVCDAGNTKRYANGKPQKTNVATEFARKNNASYVIASDVGVYVGQDDGTVCLSCDEAYLTYDGSVGFKVYKKTSPNAYPTSKALGGNFSSLESLLLKARGKRYIPKR